MLSNTKILAALIAVVAPIGANAAEPSKSPSEPAAAVREEPAIPQVIDGWELHVLDVTKSVVFQLPDGRRQAVEVPIFVYLPGQAEDAPATDSLNALASHLKTLIAKGDAVSVHELRVMLGAVETASREVKRREQVRPPFRR